MRIIINCDDLGESRQVNDSIFDLIQQGRVTSATLMMNGREIVDALARIGDHPRASFGVHLNGTQYVPLTRHPGLEPLLNEDGNFAGNLRRIPLTRGIREGLFAEWSAQIQAALDGGVSISHLDSHHHVHTEPRLFGILKRLQKKFHLRRVRITKNIYGAHENVSKKLLASKLAWNFALRHYLATGTTDGFTSFIDFYGRLRAGLVWKGSIELMCHPGGELFVEETALLWGNWKEALAPSAQLISYNEL